MKITFTDADTGKEITATVTVVWIADEQGNPVKRIQVEKPKPTKKK